MGQITISLQKLGLFDTIKEYFDENDHLIIELSGIDVSDYCDRAQVDRSEVTGIQIDSNNNLAVSFEIEYSAYYGCEDANVVETIQDEIWGTFSAGNLVFEKPPERQKRSTHEEF